MHSREEIIAGYDGLQAAFDTVAGLSLGVLTHPELLNMLDRQEGIARRWPTLAHPIIARLSAEASPVALGAKNLAEVLRGRLRISIKEARRRIGEAAVLGPRTALSGEPLTPMLARTAAAQVVGTIGAEHVAIISTFFTKLPHGVDVRTREQAETDLVRAAAGLDPDALGKAAERLAVLLDQDGPVPDDAERARKRGLWFGRQGRDGMTPFRGMLDPEALAIWEAANAKLAAPGMSNPADPTPCTSGTPTQAQIDGDHRTSGQRAHDAFATIGRNALSSGELGHHNGLPVTVIVSTTLQELESAAGVAVTGGRALLPMAEVIRLAAAAGHHYLAVFDKHTREELYLGRARRCASAAQRIMLYARDRGCTKPGCTTPAYWCQVHHLDGGWAGGNSDTNIDSLTLACPADNRSVEAVGWTTRKDKRGIVEWIPPPHIDTGQTRTNDYHHPERILKEPDEDDEQ